MLPENTPSSSYPQGAPADPYGGMAVGAPPIIEDPKVIELYEAGLTKPQL